MKKLLIVTTLAMLLSSAVGCQCCDWLFRRGTSNDVYMPACAPVCGTPCDSCSVAPGPVETYVPGPMPVPAR